MQCCSQNCPTLVLAPNRPIQVGLTAQALCLCEMRHAGRAAPPLRVRQAGVWARGRQRRRSEQHAGVPIG